MSIIVLLGAQWGDEGKGHIADKLAAEAAIVARFNGGDNAGHTITVGNTMVRTHLVPGGAFRPKCLCVLGGGMVVNLRSLGREVDELNGHGADLNPNRLRIDPAAHLLLPGHVALDKAAEGKRGAGAIGTTGRGIGPAYTDKAARVGVRAGLMADATAFAAAVRAHVERVNETLERLYGQPALDAEAIVAEYAALAARFALHLADTTALVHAALERNELVLAEGAQGALLDIDRGTYPFVTSSSTTIAGVMSGLGVGPKHISRVIGIAKAFCSRVGGGPFPTELKDELGSRLRGTGANPWDEYGSTTGRPRRTGWLDLVALRHAARINGLTEIVLTKLDILTGLDSLRVCTAYDIRGQQTIDFPSDAATLAECEPVYTELPSWQEAVGAARKVGDLPRAAQTYITKIMTFTGVPVSHVSVGPERGQIFAV
jgi:adenylosuccinate synthase